MREVDGVGWEYDSSVTSDECSGDRETRVSKVRARVTATVENGGVVISD